MNEITLQSLWKYVGYGDGKGLTHMVIHNRGASIITWSRPCDDEEIGGYSWMGPTQDFLKEFREVKA